MQIGIYQGALNLYIEMTYFKNKQYKNAKIANFVHYGKTRIASFGTTDIFKRLTNLTNPEKAGLTVPN